MEKTIKQKRLAIFREMAVLQDREEQGEDLTAELRECGKRLEALENGRKRQDRMFAIGPELSLAEYEKLIAKGWTDALIVENGRGTEIDIERIRNQQETKNLLAIAKANGISADVLRERRAHGWSDEKAATTPVGSTRKRCPYLDEALKNGISKSTYNSRRRSGWSKERASTEKPQPRSDYKRWG